MKAILVIDMPNNCYDCEFERNMECTILSEGVESIDRCSSCPLKYLGEYNPDLNPYFDEAEKAYKEGYEQCLRDITRGIK